MAGSFLTSSFTMLKTLQKNWKKTCIKNVRPFLDVALLRCIDVSMYPMSDRAGRAERKKNVIGI